MKIKLAGSTGKFTEVYLTDLNGTAPLELVIKVNGSTVTLSAKALYEVLKVQKELH